MKRVFLIPLLLTSLFVMTMTAQASTPLANPGDVVITEIMYNPNSPETNTQTQYIELFNTTGATIDLGGWTLDDEDGDGPNTIPAGTMIPAGGLVVIAGSSLADFQGAWGVGSPTVVSLLDDAQTMFNLSNSPSATSEIIQLRDDLSNLIDEVNFDDTAPWPTDNGASSIYLNTNVDATANDDGANWASSSVGTSGAINNTSFGVWSGVDVGSPGAGYTPTAVTLSSTATSTTTYVGIAVAALLLAMAGLVLLQKRQTV